MRFLHKAFFFGGFSALAAFFSFTPLANYYSTLISSVKLLIPCFPNLVLSISDQITCVFMVDSSDWRSLFSDAHTTFGFSPISLLPLIFIFMLLTDDGYVSKWHRWGINFMDNPNNNSSTNNPVKKKKTTVPPSPVATAKALKSTGSSTATGSVTGVAPIVRKPIPVKKTHVVAVGKATKLTPEEYERLRERERARILELKKKALAKALLEEKRRQEKIMLEEQRQKNEELERRLERLNEIFVERRFRTTLREIRDVVLENIGWIIVGGWCLIKALAQSRSKEPESEDDYDPNRPNIFQKQTKALKIMIKQTADHVTEKQKMDHPYIDFDGRKNRNIQEEFDEAEARGETLKDKNGNPRERPPKSKKFSWTEENEIRRRRGW